MKNILLSLILVFQALPTAQAAQSLEQPSQDESSKSPSKGRLSILKQGAEKTFEDGYPTQKMIDRVMLPYMKHLKEKEGQVHHKIPSGLSKVHRIEPLSIEELESE